MYSMSEGGQCAKAKQNRANRGKAEGGHGRAPRLAGSPGGVRAGLRERLANEATLPEKAGGRGGRPCGKAEEEGFRERGQRASWAPRLHVPGRLEGEGRAGGVRRTQTADVPSAGREGQAGAWSWASVRTSALTWGDKAPFGEFRTRRGVAHLAGSSLVFQRTRCGDRGEARETRQPGKEASGVVATRGLEAGGGQQ